MEGDIQGHVKRKTEMFYFVYPKASIFVPEDVYKRQVQAGGISLFIYMTTKKICEDDQARVFLGQVDAIPKYPEMIVWSTLLLIALLGCDMLIRETREEQSGKIIAITLGIDLVCSIVLVWILDFNYNGVILLVFANILVFVNDTKIKYLLIGVATLGYLVADYDLISVSNHLFSVRDYICLLYTSRCV